MPVVPFEFDPLVECENDTRLVYEKAGENIRIKWPQVSVDFLYPDDPDDPHSPDVETIAELNSGAVVNHGDMGFSIGRYHEFFIGFESQMTAAFEMGGIEATFGQATPLAAALFEAYRSKYHGEWWQISTVRLYGARLDEVEAALLNALNLYADKFGEFVRPFRLVEDFWEEDEFKQIGDETVVMTAPIVKDIEPLRFYSSGLSQSDPAAACIYFYRVIEYYSYLTHENELAVLRHDRAINDRDFARKVLDIVIKDERAAISKVISSLSDKVLLGNAKTAGLIQNENPSQLAEALYRFRNSIVHGKFSYGFTLNSVSTFETDSTIAAWHNLMREIAHRAIDRLGTRR